MSDEVSANSLSRTVDWKQGMFIALGVPLLILPSLCDVSSIIWGLSIVVWSMSVLQGFVQNLAYGEMVTVFPNATGLPGCAQIVFRPNGNKKVDIRKFIGAFSAWCYWFAWCPVVAIFAMLIGDYLISMFSLDVTGWSQLGIYVAVGLVVIALMLFTGIRGLDGGAKMSIALAVLSIVPICVILIGAYAVGMFDFSTISMDFTSPGWDWSAQDMILLFGCFGLAQWSACAWETAAIYGPEYKEPGKDVPKALFGCGLICLALYFFISTSVFGSLGQSGMEEAGAASLSPIAEQVFGGVGKYIALGLLIIAMILIIQTGFLGSSRTLFSMANEKNLPSWFGKVNINGMPINAMIFVSLFNLLLICLIGYGGCVAGSGETSMTILSASAMGYALANGIALAAFVKSRTSPEFKDLERPFHAPKVWTYVIFAMMLVQFCVWFPSIIYWSWYISDGFVAAALGAIILSAFIPLWYVVQIQSGDKAKVATVRNAETRRSRSFQTFSKPFPFFDNFCPGFP